MRHTRRVAKELADAQVPHFRPPEVVYLPLLSGLVHAGAHPVRILDVGGACGIAYVHVRQVVPASALEYHLVETPDVIAAVRAGGVLPPTAGLHEHLPTAALRPDIVHASSVIQYIADYAAFLAALAAYEAPYLALINSPIADMPTSATAQINMRGSVVPYWLLNRKEVTGILDTHGYTVALESLCARDYDLSNLPVPYRRGWPRNMIFIRRGTGLGRDLVQNESFA